jgi:hypothetical protein
MPIRVDFCRNAALTVRCKPWSLHHFEALPFSRLFAAKLLNYVAFLTRNKG